MLEEKITKSEKKNSDIFAKLIAKCNELEQAQIKGFIYGLKSKNDWNAKNQRNQKRRTA